MGSLGPGPVNERHLAAPVVSYGAHKLMTEIDIGDLSRRREIDGVSVRLPGIVARPPSAAGFGSAFMSDLFHKARAGEAYDCPVSREATAWWMSRRMVIENILHAARMETAGIGSHRMVLFPALVASVGSLIEGLADAYGSEAVAGFRHKPDSTIETLFGRFPELDNTTALGLGFHMDANVSTLISNVEHG
jgi:nucleoside-diphosphate-sugar epimerase